MEMTLMDHPPLNPYLGKEEGFAYRSCQVMPVLPISERGGNFKEVALGFSPTASQEEARRCLQCDLSLLFSKPVLPPKRGYGLSLIKRILRPSRARKEFSSFWMNKRQ
jgi:hypothetical protein